MSIENKSADPKRVCADIARELRSNPKAWCRGWFARDLKGNPVGASDAKACQWCFAGHVNKRVLDFDARMDVMRAFRKALGLDPELYISEWNDARERTVQDVIRVCEKVANA